MNARQRIILCTIDRNSGVCASVLSAISGAPVPSVRRAIQSLRRQGFDISFANTRGFGYTLQSSIAPAQRPLAEREDIDFAAMMGDK